MPSAPDQSESIIFPLSLPTIKQTTKLLVAEAMKRAKGNQSVASVMLGISQQALSKRLKLEKARGKNHITPSNRDRGRP
jgi:DNA-binding protein Fis